MGCHAHRTGVFGRFCPRIILTRQPYYRFLIAISRLGVGTGGPSLKGYWTGSGFHHKVDCICGQKSQKPLSRDSQ